MEWIRHGNKMEALRYYSLIPKAEKNASCFFWRKQQLTGIVTSGITNVFEGTLLKEGEGNLMKKKKI
jgi:hypothetical protein